MKVFLIMLVCLIMATPVFADNTVFWGFNWDEGPYVMTGHGYNVTAHLWTFQYVNFGEDQSVNLEVAYLISFNDLASPFVGKIGGFTEKLFIGPIAGPNADWVETPEDSVSTLFYLNGAAGAIATYNIYGDHVYGWCAAKYKFAFEDNTYSREGWKAGLGLGYNF